MKVLRILRSPCFLIVLLILIICLPLHQFSYSTSKPLVDSKARLLNLKYEFERKTLLQALTRASMNDRTVILTVVSQTWARPGSILDLFLESFRIGQGTKGLLKHLLIIAEDSQGFQHCKSRHPHCFHLNNSEKKMTRIPSGTQGNNLMLSPSGLGLLQQVIELGYNVVFTNADVMWLRNPLRGLMPNWDISISCELYPIDDETFGIGGDGGFFHVKADEVTFEFIKNCNLKRVWYPDSQHLSLCKIVGNDPYINLIGLRVNYFNEVNFGGLCQPCDLNQIYTVQANCCEDIDSKIHDLKLVLDDWRNFTALSANGASSKWSPFSWRAPQKCIG
ncbi:hypothetical protein DITRI_Ditri16bG0146400 [Diplodiscus trichospermus]